jgi:hypothetical protein
MWILGCLKLRTVVWLSALCVGKPKWERYGILGYGTVQVCSWGTNGSVKHTASLFRVLKVHLEDV